jgi:DNA-binding transcriptional LysR family regulator
MKSNQITTTLPYLRHFHAIAENRNLGRAARSLHLSAPAMTHALNQLEEVLETTLCVRSRSGFELTREGRDLYEATKLIFSEMAKFAEQLSGAHQTGGHLLIGVNDEFENPIYKTTLSKITERFPSAYLSIVVLPSEEIIKRLHSAELDIGFGIFWEKSERLHFSKIGEERLIYYISKKHSLFNHKTINRETVQGMASVWIDNESKTKSRIEREVFQAHAGYRLQVKAFTNNVGAAVELLKTGKYIVPLPDNTVAVQTSEFRQIKISKGPRVIPENFVYNPGVRGNTMKNFAIDLIEKEIRKK